MCEYDKDCNHSEDCLTTSTDVIAWLDGDTIREYNTIEFGDDFTEKLKTGLQAIVDAEDMIGYIAGRITAKIEVVNHLECGRRDEEEIWRSE